LLVTMSAPPAASRFAVSGSSTVLIITP
jgi:hypothetical protein